MGRDTLRDDRKTRHLHEKPVDANTEAWLQDDHAEWQVTNCHCHSHPMHPCPTCKRALEIMKEPRGVLADTDQLRECTCIGYSCRKCQLAWDGLNGYFREAGRQLRIQYEKNLGRLLMENNMLNSEWKGPLYCPKCGSQALECNQPIGSTSRFYTCGDEACDWDATESMGQELRRTHDQLGSVARGRNIDILVAERSVPSLAPAQRGLKQQGETNSYATGARRDSQEGKGRFDLNPYSLSQSLARRLEVGFPHYGRHNWRKGIPIIDAASSAKRHIEQAIEVMTRKELKTEHLYTDGLLEEDHLGAALFNIAILLQDEYDAQFKTGHVTSYSDGKETTSE